MVLAEGPGWLVFEGERLAWLVALLEVPATLGGGKGGEGRHVRWCPVAINPVSAGPWSLAKSGRRRAAITIAGLTSKPEHRWLGPTARQMRQRAAYANEHVGSLHRPLLLEARN